MRINGKFSADLVGLKLGYNEATEVRVAVLQLATLCDERQSRALFGDEFTQMAFGSAAPRYDHAGHEIGIGFGYKQIKPDAVCEPHMVNIAELKRQRVNPTILSVVPVDKITAAVTVTIELVVDITRNPALAGELANRYKSILEIQIAPIQAALDLVVTPARSAGGELKGSEQRSAMVPS